MTNKLNRPALTASVLAAAATAALTALGAASASTRSSSPSPPKKLVATRISRQSRTLAPGTVVRSSSLGQRVFVNARDGFALANVDQAQYPARTVDGGASWKTFGPALHVDAAQGPLAVTSVGAVNRRTVYYYGSGNVVDVTTDGGRSWWRTFTDELSLAVVPGVSGGLVWITQDSVSGSSSRAATWVYGSSDGGRVWHYTTALGGGY